MSAARWRKAMNAGASGASAGWDASSAPRQAESRGGLRPTQPTEGATSNWFDVLRAHIHPHHIVVLVGLLVFPFVASPFITFQVGAQSLALGLVALSLMFLSGYGGMVSLAQMTVAGIAGYTVAILGTSGTALSLGWHWGIVLPFALAIAVIM